MSFRQPLPLALLFVACSSSSSSTPAPAADAGTRTENPLAGQTLVTFSAPAEGATNVDTMSEPKATVPRGIGEEFVEGGRRFKLALADFKVDQEFAPEATSREGRNGVTWYCVSRRSSDPSTSDPSTIACGVRNDPLPGLATVTASVTVAATEYQNGSYEPSLKLDGTPVQTTATVHFKTKARP